MFHNESLYDTVAQDATIISHRHFAGYSHTDFMEHVTARLKRLRERAEPAITIRAMAELLEIPHSTYAAYEDRAKFKKLILPFDLARQISEVLAGRGVSPAEVMELAGLHRSFMNDLMGEDSYVEEIDVVGSVAAGRWLEETNWPPDQRYSIEVGKNPFPGCKRFGLRMEGLSMDRTIPDGSDLECVQVGIDSYVEVRPGDLVIASRSSHDLTELTCKRLDVEDGAWLLRCESYQTEFQEPIFLGKPDTNDYSDNEVRIVGLVLNSKKGHFSRQR